MEALSIARADLALRLAGRECERVERFGKGAPAGLMHHMAAYVTASGGLDHDELRHAARLESEAIGLTHPGGPRMMADAVLEALRGPGGAKPVGPDVVGEALLLRVWGAADVAEGSKAVVRAAQARGRRVAASVVRTAQDFCVGETPRTEPVEWLDALIAQGRKDLPFLRIIEGALPQHTLALRERAAEVYTLLAATLAGQAEDEDVKAERSRLLGNLGNRLSDLGRREEALEATAEALRIRRQLAAQRPDAFLSGLAMSLNNLGAMLSHLGRREEALEAAAEALRIYRRLAAQRPDAFLPGLATSLNNLGNRLSHLGRREEALEATAEALRIRRQLADKRPDAFLPDLAVSLNNLGNMLSTLGRHQQALKAADEALRIWRQLAAQRPDAFLPDLASALNNLGNRLSDLGRHEQALEVAGEALRIRRQLAAQRPDAFFPTSPRLSTTSATAELPRARRGGTRDGRRGPPHPPSTRRPTPRCLPLRPRHAESPRGISPRAAHRTGREPLDSSGSCHPVKAAAFRRNQRVPPVAR